VYWRWGNWSWRLEWAWGWRATWGVKIDDEDLTVGLSFLFGALWISVAHPRWLRWSRPAREVRLAFHDGAAFWTVWVDPGFWSSDDPRWRNGSFDFVDFLLGRTRYVVEVEREETVEVPMPERVYLATARLQRAEWRRPRWPFARRMRRVDFEMHEGHAIPFPGKGESEWDCGENATYSMTTPADTIADGIGNLVASVLQSRRRYGGRNWRPEAGRVVS